MQMKSRINTAV